MMILKKILLLVCLISSQYAFTQSVSNEEVIIGKIRFFFDGMRNVDTTGMASLFLDDVSLLSVFKNEKDITKINKGSMTDFLKAIGQPREQVWDERVHSYEIKIDGPMAVAWTEYSFYLDDTLLHCGVNVFQFVDIEGDWKIAGIMDTRRKKGCD